MRIVDAQVHIWSQRQAHERHPSPGRAFTKDDLLKEMDEAGVDARRHPSAGVVGSELQRARGRGGAPAPDRLAILGNFPLDRPESRALIDGWKKRPGMLGLRFTFLQPHQKTWPTDGTIDWLWPAAERAGLPVALLAPTSCRWSREVAERHPGLRLIVDHLGRPSGTKDDAAWASLPEMLALASHPNVAIKATGAPSYSSEPYPYRNIHDHLRQIYDAFGPERMFWGTDITRMPCSWRQCVTMFTEELPWLTGRDRELVMGEAVCSWLDWKLTPKSADEAGGPRALRGAGGRRALHRSARRRRAGRGRGGLRRSRLSDQPRRPLDVPRHLSPPTGAAGHARRRVHRAA